MLFRLDFSNEVPIYQQIRNQIVAAIAAGTLSPGEKLPTIRASVCLPEGGVSPGTLEGLRLRMCELRLAGLDRAGILELCGKLYDEEVRKL